MSYGRGYWARAARFANLRQAESDGIVADSLSVRVALIERMDAGELTLEQVKAELKKLQRGAKAAGKVTRKQAFRP